MKRISSALVLGLFPLVLFVVLAVFYFFASAITGNIFEREAGKIRPFAFAEPFVRPITGISIPSEGLSTTEYLRLWVSVSAWAWPFNAFARTNPYVYFFLAGITSFSVFVHYQLQSEPESNETRTQHDEAVRDSIKKVGLGLLGEVVAFSLLVFLFFRSRTVQEFGWSRASDPSGSSGSFKTFKYADLS